RILFKQSISIPSPGARSPFLPPPPPRAVERPLSAAMSAPVPSVPKPSLSRCRLAAHLPALLLCVVVSVAVPCPCRSTALASIMQGSMLEREEKEISTPLCLPLSLRPARFQSGSRARNRGWGRTRRTRRCSGRGWVRPPAPLGEGEEDGMPDGSFHSPEWHAVRLVSLNKTHTLTWEEFKKEKRAFGFVV
uniref:Uncharacterized protein n=1 Tax=Aegilops tauschii subsp. strangulata TaxID=200361 RepID=A0A453FGS4_AEGTS